MSNNNNKLTFKTKHLDEIILCDYCQYRKCDWLKSNISNVPDSCPEVVGFTITDEQIPNQEFQNRLKVARKIGIYHPVEKKWYFSVLKANIVLSRDLQRIIKTFNCWSDKNNFSLSSYVHYEDRVVFKTIDEV